MDGNVVRIGTSSGTAGLTKEPRTLIIEKGQSGTVTCYWFIADTPRAPAKSCTIAQNGISFVSAGTSRRTQPVRG